MSPQTLIVPIDLAPICLPMFLRVALGGLDARSGIYKKERSHCEGSQRGCDRLDTFISWVVYELISEKDIVP